MNAMHFLNETLQMVQSHQESFRSYEEVCASPIERCQFLLQVLRPAVSSELSALSKLKLLNLIPRWKRLVRQVIQENRKSREGEKRNVDDREGEMNEKEDHINVQRVALRLAEIEESKQEQTVRMESSGFLSVRLVDYGYISMWIMVFLSLPKIPACIELVCAICFHRIIHKVFITLISYGYPLQFESTQSIHHIVFLQKSLTIREYIKYYIFSVREYIKHSLSCFPSDVVYSQRIHKELHPLQSESM